MVRQVIDTTTNNGTYIGDPAKVAFGKANDNFAELYGLTAGLRPYIVGFRAQYTAVNGLTFGSGAAYIPGVNAVVQAPAALTAANLSLQPSTWYHGYLYLNGTTPALEVSATAPSAAYAGLARTKSGDTSRRYLGSVKTDINGAIIPFVVETSGAFRYLIGNPLAPLRVLANGKATSRTAVSLAGAIPVSAVGGLFLISNTDTALFANLSVPGATSSAVVGIAPGGGLAGQFVPHPTDETQRLDYFYSSTPANGVYIDVLGFTVGR